MKLAHYTKRLGDHRTAVASRDHISQLLHFRKKVFFRSRYLLVVDATFGRFWPYFSVLADPDRPDDECPLPEVQSNYPPRFALHGPCMWRAVITVALVFVLLNDRCTSSPMS